MSNSHYQNLLPPGTPNMDVEGDLGGGHSSKEYLEIPIGEPSPMRSPGFVSDGFKTMEEERDFERMQEVDALMKRRLRLLKFLLRIFTLILALYMTTAMIMSLHKYLSTRHIIIGDRNAWAKQTKTWTTVLLLCRSSITLVINSIVAAAYLKSIRAANKTHDMAGYIRFAIFVAHMGMWIATGVLYRTGKDGHDLWGWSCDPRAMKIQPQFREVVHFARYCRIQTGSWSTGLAEAALSIFSVVVYYLGYRRLKHIREMRDLNIREANESQFSKMIPTKY